jgi:lipopolysaccharide heptosyltransferase II
MPHDLHKPTTHKLIQYVLKNSLGRGLSGLRKKLYSRKPSYPGRILLFSFHGIGDAVMQTPLITRIKEKYPGSHITVVVTIKTHPVFRNNPNVDECLVYEHGGNNGVTLSECSKTLRLMLCGKRYDLALLDATGKLRGKLLAILFGARYIITDGAAEPESNFLADEVLHCAKTLHRVERNVSILKNSVMGYEDDDLDNLLLYVPYTVQEEQTAEYFFRNQGIKPGKKIIALHPGSGRFFGFHKRWPHRQYLELVNRLSEIYPNEYIMVFKGPGELDLDYSEFAEKGCLIAEKFSLLEVAALIQRASVFVGNDSGLAHLAASRNIPVVGIFGPTDEHEVRPYSKKVQVICQALDCRPCWGSKEYLQACNEEINCLASLKINAVMDGLQSCLNSIEAEKSIEPIAQKRALE